MYAWKYLYVAMYVFRRWAVCGEEEQQFEGVEQQPQDQFEQGKYNMDTTQ